MIMEKKIYAMPLIEVTFFATETLLSSEPISKIAPANPLAAPEKRKTEVF